MPNAKSIGQLPRIIKTRRRALGLTQEMLADLAGCGVVFVLQLEAGKSSVRFDKLLAVLHALGLRLELQPARGKNETVVAIAKDLETPS